MAGDPVDNVKIYEGIPMLRLTRTLVSSLAILLVASTIAPTYANAWPLGKVLHLHPDEAQDSDGRITVQIFNRADHDQNVKINGNLYTVQSHHVVAVTAPLGTPVYSASLGLGHSNGQVLVTLDPVTKGRTIFIN
jgi:hypothetical protein